MEISNSHRLKHQRLQKVATTKYESSISKAQHIKSPRQEQNAAHSINEDNIIKGEIIDLRYQEVKIRLEASGQVITARVSSDVPLSIGQTASFIVSDKTGDQITLKFLSSSSTPLNDLVYKALYSSGLGATERNIAIVYELLKFNMPLDKNTIHSFIKLSSTYPDTDLKTLVLMHKNQLPINTNSIAQFQAYQEGTHQILNQLNSLATRITDTVFNHVFNSISDSNNAVFQESDLLNPDKPESENPLFISEDTNDKDIINTNQNNKIPYNISSNIEDNSSPLANPSAIGVNMANVEDSNTVNNFIKLNKDIINILRGGQDQATELLPETKIINIFTDKEIIEFQNSFNIPVSSDSMTLKELFVLVSNLSDKGDSFASITNNPLTAHLLEAFIDVSSHMTTPGKEKLVSLLYTDVYQDIISNTLHNRWTLSPQDLIVRDKVTEYFSRLHDDLEKLSGISNSSKELEFQSIKSSINKLQDNLQFMRDLNDLFLYIQLPLRLTKQDAHGDLYVFTRKRQELDKSDQISVLLHLDMANLGPIDIHMTMKDRNVQATFYLEKSSEDIISEHLHELIDILSKKGYILQAKTQISESKPDFITDILEQDVSDQSVYRHSFDIRA